MSQGLLYPEQIPLVLKVLNEVGLHSAKGGTSEGDGLMFQGSVIVNSNCVHMHSVMSFSIGHVASYGKIRKSASYKQQYNKKNSTV